MNEIYEKIDKKYNINLNDFMKLLDLTESISNKVSVKKDLHNRKKYISLFMIVIAYIFLAMPSIASLFLKINSFSIQGSKFLILGLVSIFIGILILVFSFKIWKEMRVLKQDISKDELILAKLINNLNNYLAYLHPELSSIDATILEVRLEILRFKVAA
ncbi:hypothetical protein ABE366_00230 [Acinetobacter pittii]|uniref:hypothetical protein n=1 Tax=Acinetobacter pittii TaxID=48296 RepID=UPI0032085094